MDFYLYLHVSEGVPVRKKDEILDYVSEGVPVSKSGILCIPQVFPWQFYFMREHSLVELTEHDDSAANILVHSMYCCIHSTY